MTKNAGIFGETSSSGAAGTFEVGEDRKVSITYSKSQLRNPSALIATLAHELCHYLLGTLHQAPPGTWEDLEPLTDLAAVRQGYGVFLCESAFQYYQFSDGFTSGWGHSRQGYLSQTELAFSLALYARANDVEPMIIAPHLGRNSREYFALALEDLDDCDDWISEIRNA